MKKWMIAGLTLLLMLCLTACPEQEEAPSTTQEHIHSYTETVTLEAGCRTRGEKLLTCECGDSYTQTIPTLGHDYVENVCSRCGDSDLYAYALGTVIENPTEADFEVFYEMAKELSPGFSFVVENCDLMTLIRYILREDGSGLYHLLDFEHEIQAIGGWNEETQQEDGPMYKIYLTQDIDWALKAIFNRKPEHFSKEGTDEWGESSCYYEGDYFYRFAEENYMGNPGSWTTTFETQREKLRDGSYKITVSIAWQNEFEEEGIEPEVETGEYIAIPMHSEDMGTYWRIVSYTSLTS